MESENFRRVKGTKAHWIALWPVAQRELLAIVRTKGFWVLSVISPIAIALLFYFVWVILLILPIDQWRESDDIEGPLVAEFFPIPFSGELKVIQNFVWGEPLPYYVVDHTESLKLLLREDVLMREREVLFSDAPWLRHEAPEQMPLLEVQKTLESGWGDLAMMTPNLSIHRFREVHDDEIQIETLDEWITDGKLAGYFVIPEDFLFSNAGAKFVHLTELSRTQAKRLDELRFWFEDILSGVRRRAIFAYFDIDLDPLELLTTSLEVDMQKIESSQLSGEVPESGSSSPDTTSLANWPKVIVIPFVWTFFTMLTAGTNLVLTSTVEEKSSKVSELLVANSAPAHILDGKILGNLLVWLISGGLFLAIAAPPLIGLLGVLGGFETLAIVTLLNPTKILTWCLFLLLGFTFLGYLVGALGSLCNEAKETAMVMYPVHFISTFGVLPAVIYVMISPGSVLAQILSFVPFFSAPVMVARSAALPDWPIYCAVVLVLGISIVVMRKFSIPLFTHGMLSENAPSGVGRIFHKIRMGV